MKVYCIYMPRNLFSSDEEQAESVKLTALFDVALSAMVEILRKNDVFSFEIYCKKKIIYFTFACNENVVNNITRMIYSICPYADIHEIPDYLANVNFDNYEVASIDLKLTRNNVFPIKKYTDFTLDSLTNVVNQLSSFTLEDNVIIQIVCKRFATNTFFLKTVRPKIRRDRLVRMLTTAKYWFNDKPYSEYLKNAENKCFDSMLCAVNIRVATYISKKSAPKDVLIKKLNDNLLKISDAFKSFNHVLNGFVASSVRYGASRLVDFYKRSINKKFTILSVSEIATIWHIPRIKNIVNVPTVLSVKAPPPKDLPTDVKNPNISYFGMTNYRDTKFNFGIYREDRRRHLYILGKSGNGKSSLIKLLAKSDIMHGEGVCILDPHGDLVDELLSVIPESRVKDVIVFDPTDVEYPLTFNPFADVSVGYRSQFASSFVEVFKKTFSSIWNDNIEYLLRMVLGTLLSLEGESLLSIKRILTDKKYRFEIARKIDDSLVRNFLINEYDKWAHKFYNDAVLPLLDKIDAFTSSEYLKNIFIQKNNEFNFREIIDSNKILLLKLPKGILGDENVSLLGSMLVFKIYHAAMSRADIPEGSRKDFYFYVDEFHSFMTDSFKQILSESRKYKLNLTMANQYLGQLPSDIIDTIFGNIANIIIFGTGATDANRLAKELSPIISRDDIMNLAPRNIYVKMSVNGEVQEPFSAITLDVIQHKGKDLKKECINYSRSHYSIIREDVQKLYEVNEYNGEEGGFGNNIEEENINNNLEILEEFQDNNISLRKYLRCYGTVLLLSYLDIKDEMLEEFEDVAFSKVEELDLKGTSIGNRALKHLYNLSELIELRLDGTNITSKGMRYLTKLRRLDLLSLNDTEIDDAGIAYLRDFSIVNLSLRNTNVTNNAVQDFSKIQHLEELDIRGTCIDEEGFLELRVLMPSLIIIF